jgi:hypothetical protein
MADCHAASEPGAGLAQFELAREISQRVGPHSATLR